MLTRRFFAGCTLCAVTGFLATDASAQAPAATAGVRRTVLQQGAGPSDGLLTYMAIGEVDPGVLVARHTHPGIETGLILEGTGFLLVKGEADRALKPGDSFLIPYAAPHAVRNGGAIMRIASTYVVEKDKPLATPAPE